MTILVTIGIVARNEEKYIEKTLQSLIHQELEEGLEILVVDGNSQDNTRELAHQTLQKSGIPYKIINEVDYGSRGLCFARNLVIDYSHKDSQYIAFTDADCLVARDWLSTLLAAVRETPDNVAGAGGPRRVASTSDRKEIVINNLITSSIAMAGNPAFSERDMEWMDSIPNYNAIYKKDIIAKFRYDDTLHMSDDNELNFRLHRAGYSFRYVPDAKVYHRETNSIIQFASNMFNYGLNITNTLRKHKKLVRSFIPLPIGFLIYLILLIPIYIWVGWLIFIPLIIYFIFCLAVFIQVLLKSKTVHSLLVFILLPIQHLSYAAGILYNFISR